MAAEQFNEAERYLLERWGEVADLRKCISDMENKQTQRLENIAKRAIDSLPGGLNEWMLFGKPTKREIGVRKKKWVNKFTGLWVANISLENLRDNHDSEPRAYVYFDGFDDALLASCINTVNLHAKKIDLGKFGQLQQKKESVWYPFPETKADLIRMLTDNNGEAFDECIIKHFECLAQSVPAVDEAVENAKKSRPTN